ncbi:MULTISPECIES: HPr family phosphocarrier protein [unclassified Paenibacillus]|uniref:HPr family phosphocarrier protein n=1 Tax=unclassified Paenibacillus TaxID=185978 RepID=UPI00278605F9|nr:MULTISPECIES: HPr family phosphocarrier protein [unclassified Paenibacillus]MDQ0901218.1 phosphotransferase system HPr-like phosphotransfer protein [Paenibacillus sp. V4I7]MDQ0920285.1 phosphotransferase system HPr-like phosphotransfer protein [Paenibacillus sp. V4I5]
MKIDWTFTMNQPWTIDRVLDFVTIANRYTCHIYVGVNGNRFNAKGLLGIVSLSLLLGDQSTVVLQLDGIDAHEAFEEVSVHLQSSDLTVRTVYSRTS